MKKLNNRGFAVLEGLLILVIVGIVGGVGWYVLKTKDEAYTASNSSEQTTTGSRVAAGDAPTGDSSDGGCGARTSKLFSKQTALYTYKDKLKRFAFSYPKEWGKVLLDEETPNIVCVGPFVLSIGKAGQFGQGDDPLTSKTHGYYKQGGTYYTNWFKDAKEGPYKVFAGGYLANKIVPTANGEALLNIDNCYELGCGRVAMINLKGEEYTGVGIRSDRVTTKDAAAAKKEDGIGFQEKIPPATIDDLIDELKMFLKSFKVL